MRDREVLAAALNVGLQPQWTDSSGRRHRVAADTLRALLAALQIGDSSDAHPTIVSIAPLLVVDAARPLLRLPAPIRRNARRACIDLEFGGRRECTVTPVADGVRLATTLPPGYHALEIGGARTVLAAAPARCFTLADALDEPAPSAWGIAVQLYGLRRDHDLGFGDFTALAHFARAAGRAGAAAVAISPVHALVRGESGSYRPYSPSNRCFLNSVHADPFRPDATITDAGIERESERLRRNRLIDWPRSAALHRRLFERAYERFIAGVSGDAGAFAEFRARGGVALAHHCCFEALEEDLRCRGHQGEWPRPLKHSQASGAHAFSHRCAERIAFHAFLQWRAACGLAAAQLAAREAGMPVGLIADLAVGVDPAGSECWSRPHEMLLGASIGAPPDPLNALGQDWGLTTFSPFRLACNGYAPFLDALRASMRHAGGLRIDHVMGLMRLWLVPARAEPTVGAYLHYPFADLLRLVALESWRHRCIVIGEDLGTVPASCRRQLARSGILGLDVLAFARGGNSFLAPRHWRADAVAMTSTHDLATVAGWWQERDLDWRGRLRLYGESGEAEERRKRLQERAQLARMLTRAASLRITPTVAPARIVDAAIAAVGATPSPLTLVPLEDLFGADEQPNLPGTVDTHPNWRRRYRARTAQALATDPAKRRLRGLGEARRRRR